MITLIAPRLFDGETFRENVAVQIEGGRIAAILPAAGLPAETARQVLPEGSLLAPGLIDIQVNGGGGLLLNDSPTPETLAAIAAAHLRYGSTSILPTLISGDAAQRAAALAATRVALAAGTPGVAGLHIEGPFLSPARHGIHPAAAMVLPTEADLESLCAPFPAPLLVTLAPERVPPAAVARLIAAGRVVFAGHTDADYATVAAAFAAGVRGVTHLFNAMSPFAHRVPGAVGAALDCPGAYAGLIADGAHVHPAAVRLAFAAKGPGRICLVSDAQPPAASSLTGFTLNGQRIELRDGRLVDSSGTLAGAHLTLAECVRHAVQSIGLSLPAALRSATATPAEAMGLTDRGHLAPGLRADLVAFDSDLRVRGVWHAGAPVSVGGPQGEGSKGFFF